MSFLTPLSLILAALSIPILLLYMLKLRRRDVLVSSTLLWQRLLRDREANAPWQRLRRNLFLLLQLLILALLTLALARPFIPTSTAVSGSVVLLLDASASMQARDVEPTRFAAALRAARDIIAGLGAGDVATVIAVGPQPRVLASATGDRALLRRALEEAAPTDGPADWEAAFALAAAGLTGAEGARAVIISDGAPSEWRLSNGDGALPGALPPLPGEVRFIGVGGGGDNVAITALATREGSAGSQAFLRVVNYSDADVEPLVELSADGVLFDARRLSVPAHGGADLALADLPYDLRVLQAHVAFRDGLEGDDLPRPENALPLDDTAWAVHAPPGGGRVLFVSDGNLFLERALGGLPDLELVRLAPDSTLPTSSGEYDLYVYDGAITGTLPAGNLWLVGPQPSPPPIEVEGASLPIQVGGFFTDTQIVHVAADDPLLRYVDLSEVHVLRARVVEPPPGARVLVEARGGPLLLVAERPGSRMAVLTFDLRDSDLPLQIAFPILTANLADWLLPQGSRALPDRPSARLSAVGVDIRPGDPLPIRPDPEAVEIRVTTPDGARHVLPVGDEVPVFVATDRLGVYRVEQFDRSEQLLESATVAVNLFDEHESDIAPGERVWVGESEVVDMTREEEGRREFWPWLAGAALAVLAVEWWAYFVEPGARFGM